VIADFQLEWGRREPSTEGPIEPYLGLDRYRYLYPAGSLCKAHATIIGGSDWDISTYNPFRAFQVVVTRAGGPMQKPLNIDERIPLETAIDAYTINAAYAMKHDKITGSLEEGKRADLVVLDRDSLTTDPETIEDTKVLATYLDGRLVYSAQPSSKGEDAKDDEEDEEPGRWWDEREARMREWLWFISCSEVANVPSQQGANLMARAKKRRAWTAQDVRVLKTHSKNKTSVKAISRTMKRTPAAVRQKAAALGIPIGHSR
jgi:Amidohydrolase family